MLKILGRSAAGLAAATLLLVACSNATDSRGSLDAVADGETAPSTSVESAQGTAPPRQSDEDTVVVGWTDDLNDLDPAPFGYVLPNYPPVIALYDRLLEYDYTDRDDGTAVWTGLEVAPSIAESWEIEGAAVTFHLREGVIFPKSGNALTSADVKYSLVRAIGTEEVPGAGRFNAASAGIFDPERQIEIIDDYTVRITFERTDGTPQLLPISLPSLRFPTFGIVDSQAVQAHVTADDPLGQAYLRENPEGSGPYTLESRQPGIETVLRANPDHWSGTPDFDRVIFRVLGSTESITSLMLRGEVDVAFDLSVDEMRTLAGAGFHVVNGPVPDVWRLDLTVTGPLLNDKFLRQAIAFAIPYDTILETAFVQAERNLSYVNPLASNYEPSWRPYVTDLSRARELLESVEVDYREPIDFWYAAADPGAEDIGLLVQANLQQIGINVELRPLPATALAEQVAARNQGSEEAPGIYLRRAAIWLDDAGVSTGMWWTTEAFANSTHYFNPTVEELHLQNVTNPDADERSAAYLEIQDIIAEEVPTIPLVVRGNPGVTHPEISGIRFAAEPFLRVQYLSGS